jgi:hypothetical protein
VLSQDLIPVPVEVFGGYTPAIPPQDLPPGASPMCQDSVFPQGTVRQRGGLKSYFNTGNGANVNYLKSYLTPTLAQRLMAWDSLGNLYKENPQGTLNLLTSRPYAGLYAQSMTLFGREYQAFFASGAAGFDIPRQYDDTNWDRVTQCGPGASPIVNNYLPPVATAQNTGAPINANIAASPNGITWGGLENVYTPGYWFTLPNGNRIWYPGHYTLYYTNFIVTTTAAHGMSVAEQVTIAGSTSTPNVNGAWTIATVPSPTTFTVNYYVVASGVVAGGGGTVQVPANSLTRVSNTVTIVTSVAHGFQVGWTVQIGGFANIALGGGISSISQTSGVATCTTATANGLTVGASIIIAGTTNYNGIWVVTGVISPTVFTFAFFLNVATEATGTVSTPLNGLFTILSTPTANSFTYTQIGPNEVSNTVGTATIVGNVSGGLHQISVAFITQQGAILQAAVPNAFYAAGSQLISVSNIPTGPPNIVARLLLFTPYIQPPATMGTFYSITSTMLISDNVTNSAIIDFLDATLIASFQAEYLFTERELGECSFAGGYNARLLWLGERNKQTNFVNLGFDGGFSQTTGYPLGWTPDATYGPGAKSALGAGYTADWMDALAIVGNGAATVGKLTQTAFQDWLGVSIIGQNITYNVRARVARTAGLAQGTLNINLQSTLQAFTTPGLQVTAAQAGVAFQEFVGTLTAPLATPPGDLLLQIYASGTPTNGQAFIVDSIEIYPLNTPYNYSTAWFSHAFNPESYDNTTSQIQVRPNDGQQLRAGFPIRTSYYLAKDHYLCYVTDDGVNEPASWSGGVTEVSSTIGICGPLAVDWTEEWAVFAERSGVYIIFGGDPIKINTEILEDATSTGKVCWKSINWAAATTIWVKIDQTNRRILIGAPVNGATHPNVVFVLDYRWLEGPSDIATSPMVTYSAFTGKILAHGRGRRWCPWNISANSMCFAERNDGTQQPFFGNNAANGKIYQQIDAPTQLSDDGAPINWQYQTYYAPSSMEEQGLQLGAALKLAGHIRWRAVGSGSLLMSISSGNRVTNLRNYTLSQYPASDSERPVNIKSERFSVTVSTDAVGSWGQLEKFIFYVKKSATMITKGTNQ